MILLSIGVLCLSLSLLSALNLYGKLWMVQFKALVLISRGEKVESLSGEVSYLPTVFSFGIGLFCILYR